MEQDNLSMLGRKTQKSGVIRKKSDFKVMVLFLTRVWNGGVLLLSLFLEKNHLEENMETHLLEALKYWANYDTMSKSHGFMQTL